MALPLPEDIEKQNLCSHHQTLDTLGCNYSTTSPHTEQPLLGYTPEPAPLLHRMNRYRAKYIFLLKGVFAGVLGSLALGVDLVALRRSLLALNTRLLAPGRPLLALTTRLLASHDLRPAHPPKKRIKKV